MERALPGTLTWYQALQQVTEKRAAELKKGWTGLRDLAVVVGPRLLNEVPFWLRGKIEKTLGKTVLSAERWAEQLSRSAIVVLRRGWAIRVLVISHTGRVCDWEFQDGRRQFRHDGFLLRFGVLCDPDDGTLDHKLFYGLDVEAAKP